jgi:hypothetical protein
MQSIFHKMLNYGAFAVGVMAFSASLAYAAPIPADLAITGSTAFDHDYSAGGSGDFSLVSGGATTTSNYIGSTVTGSNPLTGPFTATGDGTGFDGAASTVDDEFAIGFDSELNVMNNHASRAFQVVFLLDWSNVVNATGEDAYADSEITLHDDSGEIFFSDFISDSLYGNEVGGIATGSFGGEIAGSGIERFAYLLNPGGEVNLYLSLTLEGGEYADGLAAADASAFLSVASVPVPAAAWLFGSALTGLVASKRRKALRGKVCAGTGN